MQALRTKYEQEARTHEHEHQAELERERAELKAQITALKQTFDAERAQLQEKLQRSLVRPRVHAHKKNEGGKDARSRRVRWRWAIAYRCCRPCGAPSEKSSAWLLFVRISSRDSCSSPAFCLLHRPPAIMCTLCTV